MTWDENAFPEEAPPTAAVQLSQSLLEQRGGTSCSSPATGSRPLPPACTMEGFSASVSTGSVSVSPEGNEENAEPLLPTSLLLIQRSQGIVKQKETTGCGGA